MKTINSASKLDAQLYPILTSSSNDAVELKLIVAEKLKNVLQEIGQADREIQQRIESTSALKPRDEETQNKVIQVLNNLNGIKIKLDVVRGNYKSLLDGIILFLSNIATTRADIEKYFNEKLSHKEENVDNVVRKHELFKESTMNKFRSLIAQSEQLINSVREQEPPESADHDTDRILSLIEKLRVFFESNDDSKTTELKKQHELSKFTKDLQEIHTSLDDVTRQLNETQVQQGDSSASAKAISLAFEYFERTTKVFINMLFIFEVFNFI